MKKTITDQTNYRPVYTIVFTMPRANSLVVYMEDNLYYWKDVRHTDGIGPFDTIHQCMRNHTERYDQLSAVPKHTPIVIPDCPVIEIDFISRKRIK